jgi:hypothetical protein
VVIGLELITQHWFYLYVTWFAPLAFVALFGEYLGYARHGEEPLVGERRLETGTPRDESDELARREAPALV